MTLRVGASALVSQLNPSIYNPNSAGRVQWRKVRAKVRTGAASQRLMCVGDSKTVGQGASSPTLQNAYPAALCRELVASDTRLNPVAASVFAQVPSTTGLVVSSGTWTNNVDTLGGQFNRQSTNTTATLIYTPPGNVDTFELRWAQGPSSGIFNYQVDAGAQVDVDGNNATTAYGLTTISGLSLGAHTLTVRRTSGTPYVGMFNGYDSTAVRLQIDNVGHGGTTASDWISTTANYSKLPALQAMAPDHTIINLGTNEAVLYPSRLTDGTFETQMGTLITAAKISGGVTLVRPSFVSNSTVTAAIQATLTAALQRLALAHDVSLIDFSVVLRAYTEALAQGFMLDDLHETSTGYDIEASCVAAYLLAP